MNSYDADPGKMAALKVLYELSHFDGPNGQQTLKKEAVRIMACQHAALLSGVDVAELHMEVPPLA